MLKGSTRSPPNGRRPAGQWVIALKRLGEGWISGCLSDVARQAAGLCCSLPFRPHWRRPVTWINTDADASSGPSAAEDHEADVPLPFLIRLQEPTSVTIPVARSRTEAGSGTVTKNVAP